MEKLTFLRLKDTAILPIDSLLIWYNFRIFLSFICNCATICMQSVKALMGISTEFNSVKIDINFVDVNSKFLLLHFSTIEILPSFCLFRMTPEFSD